MTNKKYLEAKLLGRKGYWERNDKGMGAKRPGLKKKRRNDQGGTSWLGNVLLPPKLLKISAVADFSQLTLYSKIVRSSGHLSCGKTERINHYLH